MPVDAVGLTTAEILFGEAPGCLLVEIAPEHVAAAEKPTSPSSAKPPTTRISTSPTDQLKPLQDY